MLLNYKNNNQQMQKLYLFKYNKINSQQKKPSRRKKINYYSRYIVYLNLRFIRKGVKDFFLKSKPRDKTSKNSHPNWLKNKILSGKAEKDKCGLILKNLDCCVLE